jgi:hypothetical protein
LETIKGIIAWKIDEEEEIILKQTLEKLGSNILVAFKWLRSGWIEDVREEIAEEKDCTKVRVVPVQFNTRC